MNKITISNQKGGCGKTTSSVNLAAGLAYKDKKTLLIDLDPQGNSSKALGIKTEEKQTIAELLCKEDCHFNDVVQSTYIPNLQILPSDVSLAIADIKLAQIQAKEFALKTKLKDINYDYVIIDTSPTFGTLLTNALLACEHIIIPVSLDYFNLSGMQDLIDTIDRTNKKCGSLVGHKANILGVLFSFFKLSSNHSRRIHDAIVDIFGEKIFDAKIPENVRLKESQEKGKAIYDFDPGCPSALAYTEFTNEVIKRCQKLTK